MTDITSPKKLSDVEWRGWQPKDRATLVFVVQGDRVLLIRKKRGLGAGKINAPGGRLEPGETSQQCAVREVREEVRITPTGLRRAGEHRFQFVDGYSIHVQIFVASGYTGEPVETDEATPMWVPLDAIPYDEMWEDDHLWVPHLFTNSWFTGRFLFDGDRMLDHMLEVAG
jgi:8-oxo-dGTP diphosphatase